MANRQTSLVNAQLGKKMKKQHSRSIRSMDSVEAFMTMYLQCDPYRQEQLLSMDKLRYYVPKLVGSLFRQDYNPECKSRVRGMWDKKPKEWKEGVPFKDPNNRKKDQTSSKPSFSELKQMFYFLVEKYQGKHGIKDTSIEKSSSVMPVDPSSGRAKKITTDETQPDILLRIHNKINIVLPDELQKIYDYISRLSFYNDEIFLRRAHDIEFQLDMIIKNCREISDTVEDHKKPVNNSYGIMDVDIFSSKAKMEELKIQEFPNSDFVNVEQDSSNLPGLLLEDDECSWSSSFMSEDNYAAANLEKQIRPTSPPEMLSACHEVTSLSNDDLIYRHNTQVSSGPEAGSFVEVRTDENEQEEEEHNQFYSLPIQPDEENGSDFHSGKTNPAMFPSTERNGRGRISDLEKLQKRVQINSTGENEEYRYLNQTSIVGFATQEYVPQEQYIYYLHPTEPPDNSKGDPVIVGRQLYDILAVTGEDQDNTNQENSVKDMDEEMRVDEAPDKKAHP